MERVALFLRPNTLNAVEVTSGKVLCSYMHDEHIHPVEDPNEGYRISVGERDKMLRLDWSIRCIDAKTGVLE